MAERVQTLSFRRGRLPHWLVADHSYFVTLCRKGCLPTKVVAELMAERAQLAEVGPSGTSGPTAGATDGGCSKRASTDAAAVARDVPDRVVLRPPETPVRAARPPHGASDVAKRRLDAWQRSVAYTLHNPVKAGLCAGWRDWPYNVVDPEAEALVT